jgi:hypothetical protein
MRKSDMRTIGSEFKGKIMKSIHGGGHEMNSEFKGKVLKAIQGGGHDLNAGGYKPKIDKVVGGRSEHGRSVINHFKIGGKVSSKEDAPHRDFGGFMKGLGSVAQSLAPFAPLLMALKKGGKVMAKCHRRAAGGSMPGADVDNSTNGQTKRLDTPAEGMTVGKSIEKRMATGGGMGGAGAMSMSGMMPRGGFQPSFKKGGLDHNKRCDRRAAGGAGKIRHGVMKPNGMPK